MSSIAEKDVSDVASSPGHGDDASLPPPSPALAPVTTPTLAPVARATTDIVSTQLPALQQYLIATVPPMLQGNATVFQQHLYTKETEVSAHNSITHCSLSGTQIFRLTDCY